MKSYFLNDDNTTGQSVTEEELKTVGVLYFHLDPIAYNEQGKLDQICKDRGYTYRDFVNSTKIPDLPAKLATFFEEHLHTDEEIRFFVDGSGYFDVRDKQNRWIRVECGKGDMLVLPAGIWHRFNPDSNMFFHVMRLFKGEPVWTPYNRNLPETPEMEARKQYEKEFF